MRRSGDEIVSFGRDASDGDFLATNKQKILQNKLTSGKLAVTVAGGVCASSTGRGAGRTA
jgi:hypothetical protein